MTPSLGRWYVDTLLVRGNLRCSEGRACWLAVSAEAGPLKLGPSTKALAETEISAVLSKGSGTREKSLGFLSQRVVG